ncbi:MAG: hypothetical protein AB4911_24915 [Oscillochloridaceae bacterium umkhey_bin13]
MEREIYIHQVLTQIEQARAQGRPNVPQVVAGPSWSQRLAQLLGKGLVQSGQWLIGYGQAGHRPSLEQPP